MKTQLQDTSDTLRPEITIAPATKRAMFHRERELLGMDSLFRLPMESGLAPELMHLFTRTMNAKGVPDLEKEPATPGGVSLPPSEDPAADMSQFDEIVVPGPNDDPSIDTSQTNINEFVDEEKGTTAVAERPPADNIGEGAEATGVSIRTERMHKFLSQKFDTDSVFNVNAELRSQRHRTRKMAIQVLFEVLILQSTGYVNVQQSEPYGDITVTTTDRFNQFKRS
jgi:hypothetical protein